ncbi:MAG: LysR family transcriptional regulator [Anaerovoracaceae bacterium]|jgi:DNA-binding transcriptional LysR family regulator
MTIQHLKYVMMVSECGSVTEAAKRLYISQPSLSEAIRNIEKEAGITIFNRSRSGITPTKEGEEFLRYAEQVIQQMNLLEEKYGSRRKRKKRFCVSTHHYAFSADAFVDTVEKFSGDNYEFILNETETYQIMQDVRSHFSELGIMFLSNANEKVIRSHLKKMELEFHELYVAEPHIFIGKNHPLAGSSDISIHDLAEYPRMTYLQTRHTSGDFDEEVFSKEPASKEIIVSDRMARDELLVSMNAYEICSGIFSRYLTRGDIISVPLREEECMRIGYITNSGQKLSKMGEQYVEDLKEILLHSADQRTASQISGEVPEEGIEHA